MTDRVEISSGVMQGKSVIRGTGIPVEFLPRKLAEGSTIEDLPDAYPRLAADDIRGVALPTRLTPSRTRLSWHSVLNKFRECVSSQMRATISPRSELSAH